MNENDIINIRDLYNGENPNFSFVSDIVCNIADDSNYIIQGIPLGFCKEPEEQHFWKKNIVNRYTYLFPYLVLNKWSFMYPSSKELKEWIESYMNEEEDGKSMGEKVYEQMNDFKKDSTIYEKIPYIMPEIGFIIDSYLWEKHQELPFFIRKKEFQITETIYDKYCQLFKKNFGAYIIDYTNINLLLDYCEIIDRVGGRRVCYMSLVAQLSTKKSDIDLSVMLKSIPQEKYDLELYKKVVCFYCINIDIYKDSPDISIRFCDGSETFLFWRNNLNRYAYLLLYLIVRVWFAFDKTQQFVEVKKWLSVITQESNTVQFLESEMQDFKNEMTGADQAFLDSFGNIGLLIECYMWNKYEEVPSLIIPRFISHYRDSLLTTVKYCLLNSIKQNRSGFHHQFDKCLKYAFILDSKQYAYGGGRTVLLDILSKLTDNNQSDSLEKILPVYPYYGDEFGLILLNFLKEHKIVYNLTNETISSYEHKFTFDSWWSEIKKRLGTDGKPYNAELCEMTPSHKCIIKYLNTYHYSIWNKCKDKSLQIILEPMKIRDFASVTSICEKVFDEIGEICRNEKKKIFDDIKPLTIKARAEGVDLFIKDIEKQVVAENKEKNKLTKNVHNRLYKLLMETCNNNLPDFPFETEFDDEYAQKIVILWRYMKFFEKIFPELPKEVQKSFDSSVWNKINADIIGWCKSFYENKEFINSSSNVETDTSDDDDWSDYDDLKGSERVG